MTEEEKSRLGKALWEVAHSLRGIMDANDFRDYMLCFLFLYYLSDNYQKAADNYQKVAKKPLPVDYLADQEKIISLQSFYDESKREVKDFETKMRDNLHYIIEPQYLWENIKKLAEKNDTDLLRTLEKAFKYIETESFKSTFRGLFSEINLNSEKLGRNYEARNTKLCEVVRKIDILLKDCPTEGDTLGDAYIYLIEKFAADAGKKAGEFYTPEEISTILSKIVVLDNQPPKIGSGKTFKKVLDFACGSGSLLLNVCKEMKEAGGTIDKIYGQEKNITTYNLARMNMLLHGVKDFAFEIFHGDTLINDWSEFSNTSTPLRFNAIVANPPFSYRWEPKDDMKNDARFRDHGLAPKSAADFAFLLHGFHYLADDGTMAIILPHGVLFRGGAEGDIRKKLLTNKHIDTVIGLPANLFYSTGIPVCILVLKKGFPKDDILFINAAERFEKGKRQNVLTSTHIEEIMDIYENRKEVKGFSRCVPMAEIADNDHNLNISRYVSTAKEDPPVNLEEVHDNLEKINKRIAAATKRHNSFLKQLGLSKLP